MSSSLRNRSKIGKAGDQLLPFIMKAAIFDVDGTLTDSVHLRAKAWQMSLEEFGYNFKFFEIRDRKVTF